MAVLTVAAFISKWGTTNFPSTGLRAITGAKMREFKDDIADSFQSVLGATEITSWKSPCVVATTANITLSGEQTIDGVLTSASRVLVKNQTTTSQNGIYVSAAGAWSRSTDADAAAELEGAAVGVTQGTTQQNTIWIQTTDNITLGSSAIAWQQSGYGSGVTLIDDDTFATASATTAPSSESTRAYVDAQVLTLSNVDTGSLVFISDFYVAETRLSFGQFNAGGGLGSTASAESFGVNGTENCLGVVSVGTSTSTAGGGVIYGNLPAITFGNGFAFVLKWRCALETLSDGTDTYTASVGFHDVTTSGDAVDGAYFRYTHGTNSGKWQAVTRASSVETAADTGVAADVTTYHIFEVRVNAAGDSVTFYIDGSLTNTVATNIPTSATSFSIKIEKTAGSTARKFYADYVQLTASRTTAR